MQILRGLDTTVIYRAHSRTAASHSSTGGMNLFRTVHVGFLDKVPVSKFKFLFSVFLTDLDNIGVASIAAIDRLNIQYLGSHSPTSTHTRRHVPSEGTLLSRSVLLCVTGPTGESLIEKISLRKVLCATPFLEGLGRFNDLRFPYLECLALQLFHNITWVSRCSRTTLHVLSKRTSPFWAGAQSLDTGALLACHLFFAMALRGRGPVVVH